MKSGQQDLKTIWNVLLNFKSFKKKMLPLFTAKINKRLKFLKKCIVQLADQEHKPRFKMRLVFLP